MVVLVLKRDKEKDQKKFYFTTYNFSTKNLLAVSLYRTANISPFNKNNLSYSLHKKY